ncbi:hypothetical protein GCM10008018_49190 [Paenibacillus marchantiophytorum]|uniref:Uncharacterized protein n=1 Tax=Paenibacillus marchantiophytorum TaxID=1619310 RepID=A0ABQ1F2C9_9BACL|nr:CBO0543 family protein [Paenibacillus marchantiophytorum]GFZ96979.1 hypothetical protein GCM10008018_49190 [Paenibacillus marchantiophytorum]
MEQLEIGSLQGEEKIRKAGEFFKKIADLNKEYLTYWYHHTFLHWDFILSWVLAIAPWIFWVKYRKKDSTGRLLFVGFFAIIFSSWLDFLGSEMGLWYYTGVAIPTIPSYVPWDFSLFPVAVMVLLQMKPSWSPYLKAAIYSTLCSFVAEPIFRWLGYYVLVHWAYWWSFPIYFLMYILCEKISKTKTFSKLDP